jgi:hypothetical protein
MRGAGAPVAVEQLPDRFDEGLLFFGIGNDYGRIDHRMSTS